MFSLKILKKWVTPRVTELKLKYIYQINKSIADNQVALDEAQKEYDSAKASAIIEGILGVVFTAIAIAALVAGQGELAIAMGIEAGTNFIEMIRNAVSAGKLAMYVFTCRHHSTSVDSGFYSTASSATSRMS
jgi:multidrug efflux pump subunit AcrA (membrane-fusion protein)